MNLDPQSSGGSVSPVFVEDLFLTDTYLIKGRLANKYHRLTKVLEDSGRAFLTIEDAVMISLRAAEVVRTPTVLVNRREIILAHELVEVAGDTTLRSLAEDEKSVRIRAFYSGALQIEIAGLVEPGAYEPSHGPGRSFFVMRQPVLRGLDLTGNPELQLLKDLSYAIVQKERLSYLYDLS